VAYRFGEFTQNCATRHSTCGVAHPAFKRRLDHCPSLLLRSLNWNHRRFNTRGCTAGASTRIREKKQRI